MKTTPKIKIAGLAVLLFFSCSRQESGQVPATEVGFYKPWEALGPLFHEVQMAGIFPDSKTFVDCVPKRNPEEILSDYQSIRSSPDFDLKTFVEENFDLPAGPKVIAPGYEEPLKPHLDNHWENLVRAASEAEEIATLIPLPNRYVVPGGRFREIYYWDSYFTMIGLGASGRADLVEAMVDNFAYLIDTVGFVPNGNRTYYLGRSQPPFFSSMVSLYAQLTSPEKGLRYLPAIQKEYDFWMQGAVEVSQEQPAVNRVVRLPDGTLLNRYWDFLDFPRPESHREDVELAEGLPESGKRELYRSLRAGAESGWDYSTRWFEDKGDFSTIRTTEILPVDLNCLIHHMEQTLASLYESGGDTVNAQVYLTKSLERKDAIQRIFWNEGQGAFTDYVWTDNAPEDQLTMAGAYPLYFKIATPDQARQQAQAIAENFLLPGGLVTTTIESGQQWDYPNGWAPLQWIGIKGLEHYGENELAGEISTRWLRVSEKVYLTTGKMMEKYNVVDTTLVAGGGEYPTQDGFGWTNGVALGLMDDGVVY